MRILAEGRLEAYAKKRCAPIGLAAPWENAPGISRDTLLQFSFMQTWSMVMGLVLENCLTGALRQLFLLSGTTDFGSTSSQDLHYAVVQTDTKPTIKSSE